MKRSLIVLGAFGSLVGVVPALPAPPGLPAPARAAQGGCSPDSVQVGPVCVDTYEASVWDLAAVATGAKIRLIAAITAGTATRASLLADGAVQRGVSSADYPCNPNGNDCTDIFAVSIPGVTPSAFITWFQAQQAAANSGKRLLTNAEWQMAAAGTPDDSTNCNTMSGAVEDTDARPTCTSRFGVVNMVGNLWEWVADWVPRSETCVAPLFAGDYNCFAGASATDGPGALIRGAFYGFVDNTHPGVFAVGGQNPPSDSSVGIGFRCGR